VKPEVRSAYLGAISIEQLGHDERLVRKLREHHPTRRQIATLGERDHAFDPARISLAFASVVWIRS